MDPKARGLYVQSYGKKNCLRCVVVVDIFNVHLTVAW